MRTPLSLLALLAAVPAVATAQDGRPSVQDMWQSKGDEKAKPAASKPAASKPTPAPASKPAAKPVVKADSAPTGDEKQSRIDAQIEALEQAAKAQAELLTELLKRLPTPAKKDSAPASQVVAVVPSPAPKAEAPKVEAPKAEAAAKPAAKPEAPAAKASAPLTMEVVAKTLDSLKAEIGLVEKRNQQRVSGLGNFRFSGDVRLRYEPTFQAGGFVTRHRERTRGRLHLTGATGGEFSGGISVTTGSADEVQSENQTLGGFFSRKAIAFERFYVTYKPKWLKDLSLTAGKFPGTWVRTGLTFSPDLHPEGVSGSFHFPVKAGEPDVTLVAFWLPMLEVSGGGDSYIAGGQLQTKWPVGKKTTIQAHAALLDFTGVDAIATAVGAGTLKQAQAQANTVVKDANGKVIGYGTEFQLRDAIVGIDHAFSANWPVGLSLNVTHNKHAAKDEGLGWFAEARAGLTSKPGQTQVSLTWFRIERDAVIGAFNASDLRLNTNSTGQILAISRRIRPEFTVGFTGWFGRVLDPTKTPSLVAPEFQTACKTAPFDGCKDPRMSRLQFDLIYSF